MLQTRSWAGSRTGQNDRAGSWLTPGAGFNAWPVLPWALLQTWGTAARRHPVGGLGSIGEMLIEHNHGFGQGRGSNSECSFNQAHLPHDTWLQAPRSEEHTSELQSLMRISYAVFCLKKKKH